MDYIFIKDYFDERFTNCFKKYFAELGLTIKNWDGLFEEMNSCRIKDKFETILLLDRNEPIGFIQFQCETFMNWFFQESAGFIREFWIAEKYRNQGYGTKLMNLSFSYFQEKDIHKVLLTTDTAEDFYERKGFKKDLSYSAKNNLPTYVKNI